MLHLGTGSSGMGQEGKHFFKQTKNNIAFQKKVLRALMPHLES